MDAADQNEGLIHPSFTAAGGTLAAYAVVVLGMAIVLFGIPYVLFMLF